LSAVALGTDTAGTGREWIVEAFGCTAERLTSTEALQALFSAMVAELALHPIGPAHWHQFPAPGGITGLWLLAESHLTVHTFPEYQSACINLFCCTPRAAWDWETRLADLLGAASVAVRHVERAYQPAAQPVVR
jgi:S-adenosylmethionine decarboxylase